MCVCTISTQFVVPSLMWDVICVGIKCRVNWTIILSVIRQALDDSMSLIACIYSSIYIYVEQNLSLENFNPFLSQSKNGTLYCLFLCACLVCDSNLSLGMVSKCFPCQNLPYSVRRFLWMPLVVMVMR